MRKLLAALLALASGVASAQALQARDIDGNGSVDAYYDVAQNLTWLADANYYATLGNPVGRNVFGQPMLPGQMTYTAALSFVDSLNVYGVDDWRLPARLLPHGGDNPIFCNATSCNPRMSSPSELSFLAGTLAGTSGPFSNLQNGQYMTLADNGGTSFAPVMELRNMYTNTRQYTDELSNVYGFVWAVRTGDVGLVGSVAAVPEPSTYALSLAGLLLTATWCRRKRQTLRR
ncbi:MAG TPA: PEP-CTERM sorting domain-containing protein [Rhizobacter sp.]|nr:PEP-CTERM sorting domain-containing protein [Rhizobacter sp.]